MNKFAMLLALSVLIVVSSFGPSSRRLVHEYNSDRGTCDAPLISAGWTGAPSDGNCSSAGCHSGTINTGPGVPYLMIGDGSNAYVPGESYTVTLGMSQSSIDKFGFQTTTRRIDLNEPAGENSLTDEIRTRLINGATYVGTTACGSDADPEGIIEWSYEWTAPEEDVGDITFYSNFIATNHNHSSSGDQTYSMQVTLSLDQGNSILSESNSTIGIFPNPLSGSLVNVSGISNTSDKTYSIFSSSGQLVSRGIIRGGSIDVSGLAQGTYLLKVLNDNNQPVVLSFVRL